MNIHIKNTCVLNKAPEQLSKDQLKIDLYSLDPYFRRSWMDCEKLFPNTDINILNNFCSILLKPEVFVTGKAEVVLDLLESSGFIPIYAQEITFSEFVQSELWRFQINAYPKERLEFIEWLASNGRAFYLILKDENIDTDTLNSACTRLTKLKGTTFDLGRNTNTFRSKLNHEVSYINYIHTADDALELIRELGIVFNSNTRKIIFEKLPQRTIAYSDIRSMVSEIQSETDCFDLSLNQIYKKLEESSESIEINIRNLNIQDFVQHKQIISRVLNEWEMHYLTASFISSIVKGSNTILDSILLNNK